MFIIVIATVPISATIGSNTITELLMQISTDIMSYVRKYRSTVNLTLSQKAIIIVSKFGLSLSTFLGNGFESDRNYSTTHVSHSKLSLLISLKLNLPLLLLLPLKLFRYVTFGFSVQVQYRKIALVLLIMIINTWEIVVIIKLIFIKQISSSLLNFMGSTIDFVYKKFSEFNSIL